MQAEVPGELLSLSTTWSPTTTSETDLTHPLAYKAQADPDTMYLYQAMNQPDSKHFQQAMEKEVAAQLEKGVYTLIHRSKVPEGAPLLPAVWQMRRKRSIMTGEIKKYKARLNIDGSRQVPGRDYDQTYAPVASWASIWLLLTLTLLHHWYTQQLDFVLVHLWRETFT